MARIRSVHFAICEDETLATITAEAERTFVRLWTHLDDEGRCLDNPRLIRAAIYPLHDVSDADVDDDLAELASAGLVIRYEVDGKHYLSAKPASWAEWQKPRHKYPSKHPSHDLSTTPSYVRRPSDVRLPVVGGEGRGDVEEEGAPPSTTHVLAQACGLLADKHLLFHPSRGNPDRHRAAVVRGKVADYGVKAGEWLAAHEGATAEELAEYLEPTLTAERPKSPFDATAEAQLALMDRQQKRREGKACKRCNDTGNVALDDGTFTRCDCSPFGTKRETA